MDSDQMAVDVKPNEEHVAPSVVLEEPAAPAPGVPNPPEPTPVPTDAEAPVQEDNKTEAPTGGVIGEEQEIKEQTDQKPPLAAEEPPVTSEPISEPPLQTAATPMAVDDTPAAAGPSQRPPERLPPPEPRGYTPLDRPLNVTDALGYLDAVKVQFADQPNVYNQFLDIMKEFKNELIDTPGVIRRVSQLFNGHASLIQGFNTFLPVGYRIECTNDAQDAGFITVTTPGGTQVQTTNNGPGNGPITWSYVPTGTNMHLQEPPARPGSGIMAEPPAPPPIQSPDPQTYAVSGQAIEPAVQYVQKIKQRCDAETYRQFLDILAQYHSKPDTIDEEEVSKQIARLFKDAPDLRSDFRIFMPERSQPNLDDPSLVGPAAGTRTGTPSADVKGKRKLESVVAASSRESNLPQKRKRKIAEKEREREVIPVRPTATTTTTSTKVKKHKHAVPVGEDLTPSSYNKLPIPPSPPRRPVPVPQPVKMPPANDDAQFFDNVRRVLDNRETYNEFLKVVNLFTQDFIDSAKLVKEARNFLGDGELMRQFKMILGWNERKEREVFEAEVQAQQNWIQPSVVRPANVGLANRPTHADLNVKYGSYRRLPTAEINVTCSGRDEMCRSVLNDEWVSHPTWTSEDSGFISHKKNIYEEALHRSEEERHEYDFHIEAITRTIAMLEPINNKIAQMSQDDRGGFKLKPNLGGAWKPIHTRVVKKIYGREPGLEVIQAMQDTPTVAIPVVLQRLKQKEEEWKRAQREWNKVWREVDARNYTKSLDHQAIFFKVADKKANTVKAFVNQIEAAREEQMAKRASLIDPLFARTRPRHQLEFVVDDVTVLQDVLKLTFSFLDRTQAQINFMERKRIEGFLRTFIPLFFMLDPVAFNSCFTVVQETFDSDASDDLGSIADDVELSSVASTGSRRNRKGNGISSGGDLRKKLLKAEQAKSTNRKTRAQEAASPIMSRLASPVLVDEDARAAAEASSQNRRASRRNIFFTNTTFYALLRLIEVLYSRLSLFKAIGAKLAAAGPSRSNPVAVELALPPVIEANNVGDRGAPAEHYYDLLLESLERLFDNEIEQHVFEDQMRFMFGTKEAYKSFTIDKVIGAIIKQCQTVFADPKSQDLLEILKKERSLVSPTTQDQINTRRNAEKVLGPDENLFRIDWLPESRTMTVQLIGKDDSSFDDSEVLTGRWQAYIESYVSGDTTEGVSPSKVKAPFLRRNLPPGPRDAQPNVVTRDGLEIKGSMVDCALELIFFVFAFPEYMSHRQNMHEHA
ncbi:putative histone deacetylase (HDAC) interacting [Lyophyllum shimeji]|uniref:Histone deacetylase (HDAC) interacting n=1 Tax=Lyophyllum shimeji TaxID=47721 RepID=A0A9P3PPS4_LYOSH|nr:putative histone deacetylase (HDAC) interacting [Lyophyllum shimeji]